MNSPTSATQVNPTGQTPTPEVDFYFDFSSPYSYLAAESIDDLAKRHGHGVNWIPMMLGVIFKSTGSAPLTEQHPWRAGYAVMDFQRSAQMASVPFRYPSRFPQASHNAARVLLWLQQTAPEKARPFALAVFRNLFVHDGDIQNADNLASIGRTLDIDEAKLRASIQDPPSSSGWQPTTSAPWPGRSSVRPHSSSARSCSGATTGCRTSSDGCSS
jgi:2-hydroxychromene-2-carboxylate isomerase